MQHTDNVAWLSQATFQAAMATSIPTYVCPSNNNPKYMDPNGTGSNPSPGFAVTNYKGMGASCMASLSMVTQQSGSGTAPYGTTSQHPDGAMCPGFGVRPSDIVNGLAHTILCVESADYTQSVWCLGTDCTLTGFPCGLDPSSQATQGTAVPSFTLQPSSASGGGNAGSYYMPQGFSGSFDDNGSPIPGSSQQSYSQYKTWLACDFRPFVAATRAPMRSFSGVESPEQVQAANGNSYSAALQVLVQQPQGQSGGGKAPELDTEFAGLRSVVGPFDHRRSPLCRRLRAAPLEQADRRLGLHVSDHQGRRQSEPEPRILTIWFDQPV